MGATDPCPRCGTETGSGEDWNRAFVPYEAAPNGGQLETEWVEDVPDRLHALVCTECGLALAVVEKEAMEAGEPPSRSEQFRIDRELE